MTAMIDFWDIAKARVQRCDVAVVLLSESPYWHAEGKRWLAQFVALKIKELGGNPVVMVPDGMVWEHGANVQAISEADLIQLVNGHSHVLHVLSSGYGCPVADQLRMDSKIDLIDFTPYATEPTKIGIDSFNSEWDQISSFIKLLDDYESVNIIQSIIVSRVLGTFEHVFESKYPIYFHPNLAYSSYKSWIIDGGAFDGAESVKFYEASNGAARVATFEPDIKNNVLLHQRLAVANYGDGIKVYNSGLWSKKSTLSLSGEGIAARVSQDGSDLIDLVAIDDVFQSEDVSLLKLDIEGSEADAIVGAERVLRDQGPDLAISIYHKPTDLWRLPLLIKQINPAYRFRIGQHAKHLTETVLYGWAR